MGLTSWKNSPDGSIYKYDVGIAKNYLSEEELKKLYELINFLYLENKKIDTFKSEKWYLF